MFNPAECHQHHEQLNGVFTVSRDPIWLVVHVQVLPEVSHRNSKSSIPLAKLGSTGFCKFSGQDEHQRQQCFHQDSLYRCCEQEIATACSCFCSTTTDPYDTEKMAMEFLMQFPKQAFTVGQQLVFAFEDKKVLSLVVKELEGQ